MSEQTTLLEKLEGLLIRFEEIGTLITPPCRYRRYEKVCKTHQRIS